MKSEPIDCFKQIYTLQNRGISFVSVLQEVTETTRLSYRSNESVKVAESDDWGVGFYLENEGKKSFVSTNRMNMLDVYLYQATKKVVSDNPILASKPIKLDNSNPVKSKVDISNHDEHPIEDGSDVLRNIGKTILAFDPSFRFDCQMEIESTTKVFQSSNFQDITQRFDRQVMTIELLTLGAPRPYRLKTVFGGLSNECLDWNAISDKLIKMLEDYQALLNSPPPRPGKYQAILSPDTSFSLIHESIGHAVEADQVVSGNSFLSSSIGYPIASHMLNITDDPNIKTNGWLVYDDEGVKSQGTQLVEDGILVNFLHSKATARQLDSYPTGNARSSSYIAPPEPRQSNLFIEPGDMDLEEMIAEIRDGLLIGTTREASTSIYSGQYVINTQFSYQIKNGEIIAVLGPSQIADHSLITLNGIEKISRETEKIPSQCLKDESVVHIGGLAPYIQVDGVTIR